MGFHVSIADSIDLAIDRALETGSTTFQIFTRNPRGWKFKQLQEGEVLLFREKRQKNKFEKVVAHMSYLPNLSSPLPAIMKQSRSTLNEEVRRCDALGIDYLVIHLGSHMGSGVTAGARKIADACNEALTSDKGQTMILLENMAGQKNSVGSRFEELRLVLDGVENKRRVGVCFDTCHAFAAGFDLSSKAGVENTMGLFGDIVGLEKMRVVHLNDSKGPVGGGLDRHEHVGLGKIGQRGIREFLNYPGIARLPVIMETPIDDVASDREDMKMTRRLLGKG